MPIILPVIAASRGLYLLIGDSGVRPAGSSIVSIRDISDRMWTLTQILVQLQKQTALLQDIDAKLAQIITALQPPHTISGVQIVFGQPKHK